MPAASRDLGFQQSGAHHVHHRYHMVNILSVSAMGPGASDARCDAVPCRTGVPPVCPTGIPSTSLRTGLPVSCTPRPAVSQAAGIGGTHVRLSLAGATLFTGLARHAPASHNLNSERSRERSESELRRRRIARRGAPSAPRARTVARACRESGKAPAPKGWAGRTSGYLSPVRPCSRGLLATHRLLTT